MLSFVTSLSFRWHRYWFAATTATVVALVGMLGGCTNHQAGNLRHYDRVIGSRGGTSGKFNRPRGITLDPKSNLLYVVDWDGRIQVFTQEGEFRSSWIMPAVTKGKPEEIALTPRGTLIVADTHYSRVVEFNLQGEVVHMFGTYGKGDGQFIYPVGLAVDAAGNIFVSEYGENDRIQKFTADGEFITKWGHFGTEPGEFQRPSGICIGGNDRLYVADAVNHRVQVFDLDGKLLSIIGSQGSEPGQFGYPYDVGVRGDTLYVLEYGNQRVQRLTLDGKPIDQFGEPGGGDGQLSSPWRFDVAADRVYVSDTQNYRVIEVDGY